MAHHVCHAGTILSFNFKITIAAFVLRGAPLCCSSAAQMAQSRLPELNEAQKGLKCVNYQQDLGHRCALGGHKEAKMGLIKRG